MPGPLFLDPKSIKDIQETYPDVFAPGCRISINKGWWPLLVILADRLQSHIDEYQTNWPDGPTSWPRLTQVKEKFGVLRIYKERGYVNIQLDDVINTLVALSHTMCAYCGCPGEKQKVFSTLDKVLCEDCRVQLEEDFNSRKRPSP